MENPKALFHPSSIIRSFHDTTIARSAHHYTTPTLFTPSPIALSKRQMTSPNLSSAPDFGGLRFESVPLGTSAHHLFHLEILDEGGANVIYEIRSGLKDPKTQGCEFVLRAPDGKALPGISKRLLRVRKTSGGSGTTVSPASHEETLQDLKLRRHLDERCIISMESVRLGKELRTALNQQLKCTKRAAARQNTWIDEDQEYAYLIEDMRVRKDGFLVEFKPKWLSQSPDAPKNSIRCRTCALRARRRAEESSIQNVTKTAPFCPLGLVSGKTEFVEGAVEYLLRNHDSEKARNHFVNYFALGQPGNKLLRSLKQAQDEFSAPFLDLRPCDCDSTDCAHQRLKNAMVLRDCSLFLRYRHSTGQIEAKVADLDEKDLAKLSIWQKGESKLIDGGYYSEKGITPSDEESQCWFMKEEIRTTIVP